MKFKIAFIFPFLLSAILVCSQDSTNVDEMFVKKDFLIILSTKDYKAALATAKQASSSMNIQLQLRGLAENKESGLTIPKEDCEKAGEEYPAYYARGRWDDGAYISIEYSDAYSGFSKGYYIVIAASGSKEEKEIQSVYKKIKPKYKDAYFKSSKVYLGCMH
jgi:hypothetical protein